MREWRRRGWFPWAQVGAFIITLVAVVAQAEEAIEEKEPVLEPVVTAGDQAAGFVQRMIGVRGAVSQPGLYDEPDQRALGGGMLYERGTALLQGELFSARYLDELWIGYDGGGMSYSLSAQMGFGVRWAAHPWIGPLVRFEMRGEMRRQGGWYYSSLRLPGAQLGAGAANGPWLWELLGHGGASLTGRLRNGEPGREVTGGVVGGAMSLAYESVRLDADVSYLGIGSQVGGLWDARAHFCSYWGKKKVQRTYKPKNRDESEFSGPFEAEFPVAVCADASLLENEQAVSQAMAPRQQIVLGISFLVGRALRLDPAGGTCNDANRRCP